MIKRSPERGVQQSENGSVCPYSECQRQHNNNDETGRPAEQAGGEAQILPPHPHQTFPTRRAAGFLRNFQTPPLPTPLCRSSPASSFLLLASPLSRQLLP